MTALASKRVLFVADGSPAAGLGHVVRSSALASALSEIGIAPSFLVQPHRAILDKLHSIKAQIVDEAGSWDGEVDAPAVVRIARNYGCETVVIDSYRTHPELFSDLAVSGVGTIVLDDLALEPLACDIVINGGAQAERLDYRPSSGGTVFLLGPRYALLRQEFWSPQPRRVRPSVQRILVTLGGGASPSVVDVVVEAVDRLPIDFELVLMRGPFTGGPGLHLEADGSKTRAVRVLDDPSAVYALMRDADVAVCSGGQTMYELAAVGTPAVAIEFASNQHESLVALASKGVVRQAGIGSGPEVMTSLGRILGELCEHRDQRAAMASAGQQLVDGGGARRAAAVIARLIERRATHAMTEARPR